MISCTEFIPAYSELFKFIEKKGGKQAVVKYWETISKDGLDLLRKRSDAKRLERLLELLVTHAERRSGGLHYDARRRQRRVFYRDAQVPV